MRKRERFILSSILLSLGLIATQLLNIEMRPVAIILFFISTYFISAWTLSKNLNGIEWFTIVPFPAFYALSVSLFYFLLPTHILSRLAIITLFGVGMYALYLTSNIYSIGKLKTIQLLRAAHAVGYLFLLLMALFMFNFILSLGLAPYFNGPLIAVSIFIPLLCAIWSINLHPTLTKRVLFTSIFFSLLLGELGIAISLFPVSLWPASLFLVSILYVGFGIVQNYAVERLFARTLQEYIWLAAFVSLSFLLLVSWK